MRTQITKCEGRNADGEKCKRWFHLHRQNRTGLCQVCGEGYSKPRANDGATKSAYTAPFFMMDFTSPPEAKQTNKSY